MKDSLSEEAREQGGAETGMGLSKAWGAGVGGSSSGPEAALCRRAQVHQILRGTRQTIPGTPRDKG